jgi:hypothetical protein
MKSFYNISLLFIDLKINQNTNRKIFVVWQIIDLKIKISIILEIFKFRDMNSKQLRIYRDKKMGNIVDFTIVLEKDTNTKFLIFNPKIKF